MHLVVINLFILGGIALAAQAIPHIPNISPLRGRSVSLSVCLSHSCPLL